MILIMLRPINPTKSKSVISEVKIATQIDLRCHLILFYVVTILICSRVCLLYVLRLMTALEKLAQKHNGCHVHEEHRA
jgi:hypothetical protein